MDEIQPSMDVAPSRQTVKPTDAKDYRSTSSGVVRTHGYGLISAGLILADSNNMPGNLCYRPQTLKSRARCGRTLPPLAITGKAEGSQ